jgi:aerobic carbon-monoxide dehydrogenase medium subunit
VYGLLWERYVFAKTSEEALAFLSESQGGARLMAGGTDLMLLLKTKGINVHTLVDIEKISELKKIGLQGDSITVGALATHRQVAESTLIKEKARALAEASLAVGSPQIRNVGTIGGNVVTAQPAADASIALVALDARVQIIGEEGRRELKVRDTFLGPGKSVIDPTRELVTAFTFQKPTIDETTAFVRYARRKSLALPVLNMAIWLKMDKARTLIEDVRIAMGPMAAVPLRAVQTEEVLKEGLFSAELLKKAAQTAAEEAQPRDSFRGSADYKKDLVMVFLQRIVEKAVHNLRGEKIV